MIESKVQMIDIDKIIPYERNAKKHPESQIVALAEMIKEYGFDVPLVVDKDMVLVKGHGRRLSALRLGLKQVPVIVRSDLSAAQIRASRIADNKIAETDWDMEQLKSEVGEVDQDLLNLLGFEDQELERLLKEEEKKQVTFEVGEKSTWELIVTMSDEDDQQDLFIELRDRGYKVKAK